MLVVGFDKCRKYLGVAECDLNFGGTNSQRSSYDEVSRAESAEITSFIEFCIRPSNINNSCACGLVSRRSEKDRRSILDSDSIPYRARVPSRLLHSAEK